MNPDLVRYPVTFPTLGWEVASWIESYLCHGPGDIQGQQFTLDMEEMAWLCWAYRLYPRGHEREGKRMVHRAVYCRPKGARKSELGGAVCCAEALGPVRFGGWNAEGEPVGVPVTYPFVRIMATEEEQSSNIYENVAYMLAEGRVHDEYSIDIGRSVQTSTRVYLGESGGAIVPSTSGDASKDGGKESHCAADESHLMNTKQLRNMYRTVARNTGKRIQAEPWIAEYTTAWQPGEDSIAEQAAAQYASMPYEEAISKHGVLWDHRQGPVPAVFGQDASLRKALRAAYGPYKVDWTDLDKIVRIIRDSEDPEAEGFRYYLNIPRAGASQWIYPQEIDAVVGNVEIEPGELVTLGFDGSESDDHTVLWVCTESGDLRVVGAWTPERGSYEWRQEVLDAIEWAFAEFEVVRFYADPPYWQSELGQLARKYGSPPVTEFWTNVDSKMAVATGALRTAIRQRELTIDPEPLRTDQIRMDGRPLALWHFTNARTRKVKVRFEDRAEEAWVVRKDKPAAKIDSVPSAVLARAAWQHAVKADEWSSHRYTSAAW